MRGKYQTVCVTLPYEAVALLNELVKKSFTNRSQLVRVAVAEYLEKIT